MRLCRTFCAWHRRLFSLCHGKSLRSSLLLDNISKCSEMLFLPLLLVFSFYSFGKAVESKTISCEWICCFIPLALSNVSLARLNLATLSLWLWIRSMLNIGPFRMMLRSSRLISILILFILSLITRKSISDFWVKVNPLK